MAAARRKRKNNRGNSLGILAVAVVSLILVAVLAVQTIKMRDLKQDYEAQRTRLTQEISREQGRRLTLEEQRIYTQTKQYVEEQARIKFGLIMPDEILIKGED